MAPVLMHWAGGASGVAANAFVAGVWQGLVLAAAVWLCLQMVPRVSAAVRFAVWSAVYVMLVLLPLVRIAGWGGQTMSGRGAMLHAVRVDVRWSFAIAMVWAAVSMVRAVRLTASAVRLRKIWKNALPVAVGPDTVLPGLAAVLAAKGKRRVELCTSTDVDCPSVIGFFSPRVLIPAELFGRLTAPELEQIVLHELGHLRRADDWINLLQKIGLVVFPLNPALLWIERRLCLERELACDDDVLRSTGAPKAYATCLTTLAERGLERRAAAVLSLGAWERQSELSRRVYSILRWRDGVMGTAKAGAVMGVLVLGLMGGAAELSRLPQLVSFSPMNAAPVTAAPMAGAVPAASLPGYDAAEFDAAGSGRGAVAHETLLKASMPVKQPLQAAAQRREMRRRHCNGVQRDVVQRAKKRVRMGTQQMVVLTSWFSSRSNAADGSNGARMVLTVAEGQSSFSSYAAVRTAGGWLVFQL